MHEITFVSTVHKANGNCNADELCVIIETVNPEVVFLEAIDETYSEYQKHLFSNFEIYHEKLEIISIQKYSLKNSFKYIPVLENTLSDAFDKKYELVCQFREFQKLLDNFNSFASELGFKFLNSPESIKLQEQMRQLESKLINNELEQTVNSDINKDENSMMDKIYSYTRKKSFNSAIFMCGVAHRKAIIEKINKYNAQEQLRINWTVYQ